MTTTASSSHTFTSPRSTGSKDFAWQGGVARRSYSQLWMLRGLLVALNTLAFIIHVNPASTPHVYSAQSNRAYSPSPRTANFKRFPGKTQWNETNFSRRKFGLRNRVEDVWRDEDFRDDQNLTMAQLWRKTRVAWEIAFNASTLRHPKYIAEEQEKNTQMLPGLLEGMPEIPQLVQDQMVESDWGDVWKLFNLSPNEDDGITMAEVIDRMQGRSRLLTEYLRQRLVRLENGTLVPVPKLYPEIFEQADEFHDLQDGYVTRYHFVVPDDDPLGEEVAVPYLQRIEDSDIAPYRQIDDALWQSAESGCVHCVRNAIQLGADPNSEDKRLGQWTAMHRAAGEGHALVLEALIECGADAKVRTGFGFSPLHTAASEGHIEAMRVLIHKGGVDVNVRNRFMDTPLHRAAVNGKVAACKELVALGADLRARNYLGETASMIARSAGLATENATTPEEMAQAEKWRSDHELLYHLLRPVSSAFGEDAQIEGADKRIADQPAPGEMAFTDAFVGEEVVFVGRLRPDVSERDLVEFFKPCGQVAAVKIVQPRPSGIEGAPPKDKFALVRFKDIQDAVKALGMSGKSLKGQAISTKPQGKVDFNPRSQNKRPVSQAHRHDGSTSHWHDAKIS